jgi:hypothetical protein
MSLQTKEAVDHRLNSFWRAVVLSDEAPAPMHETIKLFIDSKLELVGMAERDLRHANGSTTSAPA